MAYFMMIRKGKEYQKLDIVSLDRFKRSSNLKGASMSLEEIDYFTSRFKDETELKKYLCVRGALDIDDINREISIRRKNKDEYIKVRYGLVYSDDIKYLDKNYIRDRFLSNKGDIEFMTKVLDYYRNTHKQSMIYLMRAIMTGMTDTRISLGEALDQFIIDELYDTDYLTGEAKLRYKSLHDMGMFLRNYEEDKKRFEEKKKIKVLKRVKEDKNQQIEGQTSLFEG